MFTTPILVIIFNRPDFSKNIFLALKQLQPARLYVISDGARTLEEEVAVIQSRDIFNTIDWKCEVKYNYSDVNLGLRKRISGGISWAFQNEEELIILEDDCIPNPDFFMFCNELLGRYKGDERIMCINGCNLNPKMSEKFPDAYFFSRYANSWGWATWKRAWNLFDSDLEGLENRYSAKNFTYYLPYRYRSASYWNYKLTEVKNSNINSWAYRWMFTLWINNGLAIVPHSNLIRNIGNDNRSTNTRGRLHYINISTSPLNPDKSWNPRFILANANYDRWLENSIYSKSILTRIMWFLKKIVSW